MAKTNKEYPSENALQVVRIRLVQEPPILSRHPVHCPQGAIDVMVNELKDYDREVLCVLNLNTDRSVINMNIVSMGSLNSSCASPREIFKSSILSNASAIILMHNHPSGNARPSRADYSVTSTLVECGKLLDIPVLDHIIVSGGGIGKNYSFFEHGDLELSEEEGVAKLRAEKSKADRSAR